jgi:hypothetical protein
VVLNKADLVAGDILAGVRAKIAARSARRYISLRLKKALCRSRFCLAAAQRLRMTWPPVTNITITTMMMTIIMITMIIITTTTTIMIIITTMTLKAM